MNLNLESRLGDRLPWLGGAAKSLCERRGQESRALTENNHGLYFFLFNCLIVQMGKLRSRDRKGLAGGPPLVSTPGPSPDGQGCSSSTRSSHPGHKDSVVDGGGLSPTTNPQGARLEPQF